MDKMLVIWLFLMSYSRIQIRKNVIICWITGHDMSSMLENIANRAKKMKNKGTIEDIALENILNDIKQFKKILLNIEKKWIANDHKDSFYFYQAAHNLELFLDIMSIRFVKAKANDDNSQIVLDALAIIPIATEIFQIVDTVVINSQITEKLLEKTHQLRDMADNTNLIESENNINEIDHNELGKTFEQIMEQINSPAELPNHIEIDETDKNLN